MTADVRKPPTGSTFLSSVSLPATPSALPLLPGHPAFVVVVETAAGKHRRRVYLSLHAAERALRSSWSAGHEASIVLCKLTPVECGDDDA